MTVSIYDSFAPCHLKVMTTSGHCHGLFSFCFSFEECLFVCIGFCMSTALWLSVNSLLKVYNIVLFQTLWYINAFLHFLQGLEMPLSDPPSHLVSLQVFGSFQCRCPRGRQLGLVPVGFPQSSFF